MIKLTQGDLLKQDDVDAIVNTVNCVGVMGKGIALQFKNKWPDNFAEYAAACKAGQVRPGRMFIHDSGGLVKPNYIINFPTKDHWRGASKMAFIRDGLIDLVTQEHAHKLVLSRMGTTDHGPAPWAPSDAIRLVSCSNVYPLKRVDLIVAALKHIDRPVHWTHFGDGPEMDRLRRLAKDLPANVIADFRGAVANTDLMQCTG